MQEVWNEGIGLVLGVKSCKIVFLWGHFLFTCSDTWGARDTGTWDKSNRLDFGSERDRDRDRAVFVSLVCSFDLK